MFETITTNVVLRGGGGQGLPGGPSRACTSSRCARACARRRWGRRRRRWGRRRSRLAGARIRVRRSAHVRARANRAPKFWKVGGFGLGVIMSMGGKQDFKVGGFAYAGVCVSSISLAASGPLNLYISAPLSPYTWISLSLTRPLPLRLSHSLYGIRNVHIMCLFKHG